MKCKCYQEKIVVDTPYDNYQSKGKVVGYCTGTKECDECSCGGDQSKCDFYPKNRKEDKVMHTHEMWTNALKDGKTYEDKYKCVCFQRDKGLFDSNNGRKVFCNELLKEQDCLTDFMNIEWKEVQDIMTKSEAEKKFNIKIVGE